MRRREIEPGSGTHCLHMHQKFHAKFPPITLYDDVSCNHVYVHVL